MYSVYPKMFKKWHQNHPKKCWTQNTPRCVRPPCRNSIHHFSTCPTTTAHIDITPPKLAARPRNSMSQTWRWKQSPLDSTSSDRAECWSNLLKWWSFSLETTNNQVYEIRKKWFPSDLIYLNCTIAYDSQYWCLYVLTSRCSPFDFSQHLNVIHWMKILRNSPEISQDWKWKTSFNKFVLCHSSTKFLQLHWHIATCRHPSYFSTSFLCALSMKCYTFSHDPSWIKHQAANRNSPGWGASWGQVGRVLAITWYNYHELW